MLSKKNRLIILTMVAVALVSLSAAAFAAPMNAPQGDIPNNVLVAVERAEAQLEQAIAHAMKMGAKAKTEEQLDMIVDQLLNREAQIIGQLEKMLARYDIVIEHDYIDVEIGDRVVTVDPIRIISW